MNKADVKVQQFERKINTDYEKLNSDFQVACQTYCENLVILYQDFARLELLKSLANQKEEKEQDG